MKAEVTTRLSPKAVVVASGGFQADIDWLTRAWGPACEKFPDPRHTL